LLVILDILIDFGCDFHVPSFFAIKAAFQTPFFTRIHSASISWSASFLIFWNPSESTVARVSVGIPIADTLDTGHSSG
jgi:hypothetical protein